MTTIFRTAATLSVPLALLSTTALADLAPGDVWSDWRQYMQGMGYTIQATETADGADLVVSDILMSMAIPEDDMTISMSLGTLTFTQNGAETVNIVVPGVLPITVKVASDDDGDKPVTATMSLTQGGHTIAASGSPDKITYDYAAQTFGLSLTQLQVGPKTYGAENAKFDVTATDVSSTTTMTVADLRGYEQTGSIASLQYDVLINNPEDPIVVKLAGNMTDLATDGRGMIPMELPSGGDMASMLKAGFDVTGNFTYATGSSDVNVTDPENGNFHVVSSSGGGTLGIDMGKDELSYSGSQKDLNIKANVDALPFPIELSMAEGGFNMNAPVSKSDEIQDFAFGLKLADFKMSDMIWGIFDPNGQLPRDPATLVVDLSGKAKLLVDYMDPAAAAKMGDEAPGELHALSINQLLLDAVGARLEGAGDVTFDNSDMTTVPGMPKPVGAVNLSLAGANSLLDKLVAMGLLPQEQAMGVRMMMGMFGVPGESPDTLKSKIEFTQDGQILANGQRIK